MKIEYLEIKNYKQFADLELVLTYPRGHQKEGKPLDKICIIGQSGTGKTNLLEIIKERSNARGVNIVFDRSKLFNINEKIYFIGVEKVLTQEKSNEISDRDQKILEELEASSYELLAKDNGDYSKSEFEHKMIHGAIDSIKEKYNKKSSNKPKSETLIEINIDDNNSWEILKEKIDNYEREKSLYTKQLFNQMMYDTQYSKEASIQDMKKWEEENENILERIAGDINSIIQKFNLQLQINETTNSYDELIIKDLSNGNTVKYDDLSTGTKNLLSTFIPLKSYNPKESIILIDEPENSFYPDIQRQLTDLYMNVGENNQLIMATHSPLIASSFEPWEVVELKFDENNQVYREFYFDNKKENHVDNYFINPQLLTWTGILTDVFDLQEDSNFTKREKELMKYATLKAQIKLMADVEEKEKAFVELKKISKLLGLYN